MMVTFLEVEYVTDIMYVQGAQSISPKIKNTILMNCFHPLLAIINGITLVNTYTKLESHGIDYAIFCPGRLK